MEYIGPIVVALITAAGGIWVAYLRWGKNPDDEDDEDDEPAAAAKAVLDHRRELIDHLYEEIDSREAAITRLETQLRDCYRIRNEAQLQAVRLEERLKALREDRQRE